MVVVHNFLKMEEEATSLRDMPYIVEKAMVNVKDTTTIVTGKEEAFPFFYGTCLASCCLFDYAWK